MPAVTFLSDHEVREWANVPDDKEADELLQQLRDVSGRNWVIGRHKVRVQHPSLIKRLFCKPPAPLTVWTLYLDCHGEWQIMSLATPKGSSIFHYSPESRECVLNYMLGYVSGAQK